jgi:hypothetical protein
LRTTVKGAMSFRRKPSKGWVTNGYAKVGALRHRSPTVFDGPQQHQLTLVTTTTLYCKNSPRTTKNNELPISLTQSSIYWPSPVSLSSFILTRVILLQSTSSSRTTSVVLLLKITGLMLEGNPPCSVSRLSLIVASLLFLALGAAASGPSASCLLSCDPNDPFARCGFLSSLPLRTAPQILISAGLTGVS